MSGLAPACSGVVRLLWFTVGWCRTRGPRAGARGAAGAPGGERAEPLTEAAGRPGGARSGRRTTAASCSRSTRASCSRLLGRAVQRARSRGDRGAGSRLPCRDVRYYRFGPAAAPVQLAAPAARAVQARSSFPRWPLQTGLHDLYDWLLDSRPGRRRPGALACAPWPDGRSGPRAHPRRRDRPGLAGHRAAARRRGARAGYRSSWNFVPERYTRPDAAGSGARRRGLRDRRARARHDGRDLASARALARAAAGDARGRRRAGARPGSARRRPSGVGR